eukprot:363369-Chlamydomonas_euryale.AAC.20
MTTTLTAGRRGSCGAAPTQTAADVGVPPPPPMPPTRGGTVATESSASARARSAGVPWIARGRSTADGTK